MGSLAEIKEASIMGPVAITTALGTAAGYEIGTIGCFTYASSTASASAALPSVTRSDGVVAVPLQKRYMRVFNRSATTILDFAFGLGSAPTLVAADPSVFATGDVNCGAPIAPMSYQDFIVPPGATHCAWILEAGGAASAVTMWCAEGQV